jgi:hypothetical protein
MPRIPIPASRELSINPWIAPELLTHITRFENAGHLMVFSGDFPVN